MTRLHLFSLCCSLAVLSLQGLHAFAQTYERLLQVRLISPAVYEDLNRRGATTRAQRIEVVEEACVAHRCLPVIANRSGEVAGCIKTE